MIQARPPSQNNKRFKLIFSLSILGIICILCACYSLFAAFFNTDAYSVTLENRFGSSSANHLLGTDNIGRDIFLRLLRGGQNSLLIGFLATIGSIVFGVIIGMLAGYYRGWLDSALMRFTDTIIALPLLPLLIILAGLENSQLGLPEGIQGDIAKISFLLALMGWTTTARLIRSEVLSLKERDFTRVAQACGGSDLWLMRKHIFPNTTPVLMVAASLTASRMILLESGLSFLGFGIQPPEPTWGNMLTNAQEMLWRAPELAFYPGICIFLTVYCFLSLNDALQLKKQKRPN